MYFALFVLDDGKPGALIGPFDSEELAKEQCLRLLRNAYLPDSLPLKDKLQVEENGFIQSEDGSGYYVVQSESP